MSFQIIGPKASTEPQAGLDSTTRAGLLARLIVKNIAAGGDPEELLSYNPVQWTNATHHQLPATSDWLQPVDVTINGHEDSFSQRYRHTISVLAVGGFKPGRYLIQARPRMSTFRVECTPACAICSRERCYSFEWKVRALHGLVFLY